MTTLGGLASSLAHELNQPLSAIANYVNAMRREVQDKSNGDTSIHDDLRLVAAQAEHAGHVIRKLRGFVENRSVQNEPFDPETAVQSALELTAHTLRRNEIDIDVESPNELPRAMGDRLQLEQVIINVVQNAVDAMVEANSARKRIVIRLQARPEDTIEIAIEDSGPGISSGDYERIFDSFYTTKTDGLGLGLGMCRMLIESQGGKIHAESAQLGGLRVIFTLPTATDGEKPATTRQKTGSAK